MNVPADAAHFPANIPPRRISGWIAAASLLSLGSSARIRSPLKFFLRSLSQPRLTHAWLARLIQPDLAPLWTARPRLATKLQRPYVNCAWSTVERFDALMGHYDSLARCLIPAGREAIYRSSLPLIALVNSTSGRRLEVRLTYQDQFEKEGELTLVIQDVATGLTLAGLTFCLKYNHSRRHIVIGGLQASHDSRMRELIRAVTKECHGMRPKALALWCLQELASCWQVSRIQAVGDAQHIYRHAHKRRDFSACYDEFWSECDGRRLAGGGWELPLELCHRTREELKPSRRRPHERRYAMLAAIRPTLLMTVQTYSLGAASVGIVPGPLAEVVLPGRESATKATTHPVALVLVS